MKVSNEIISIFPEIKKWRHELHANPELGYEEEWTSNFVAEKLESFGLEIHRGMAKTGVVGVLKGANASLGGGGNKAIGLRADMDALPMTEENEFSHKSKFDGRMHACGHDGHTAMLLGAANYCLRKRILMELCILYSNLQKKVEVVDLP